MNESDFENRLRLLVPVEPSRELEERIALALEARVLAVPAAGILRQTPASPARPWLRLLQGFGWAAAGATAGVAAMFYFYPAPSGPAPAQAALFEPSESAREVVSTSEEETVYSAGNEPARFVRYSSIERHAWTNPATGAWVQVEMPREDVVALPVSYQ